MFLIASVNWYLTMRECYVRTWGLKYATGVETDSIDSTKLLKHHKSNSHLSIDLSQVKINQLFQLPKYQKKQCIGKELYYKWARVSSLEQIKQVHFRKLFKCFYIILSQTDQEVLDELRKLKETELWAFENNEPWFQLPPQIYQHLCLEVYVVQVQTPFDVLFLPITYNRNINVIFLILLTV